MNYDDNKMRAHIVGHRIVKSKDDCLVEDSILGKKPVSAFIYLYLSLWTFLEKIPREHLDISSHLLIGKGGGTKWNQCCKPTKNLLWSWHYIEAL